jgi:hypothetical protein
MRGMEFLRTAGMVRKYFSQYKTILGKSQKMGRVGEREGRALGSLLI